MQASRVIERQSLKYYPRKSSKNFRTKSLWAYMKEPWKYLRLQKIFIAVLPLFYDCLILKFLILTKNNLILILIMPQSLWA